MCSIKFIPKTHSASTQIYINIYIEKYTLFISINQEIAEYLNN